MMLGVVLTVIIIVVLGAVVLLLWKDEDKQAAGPPTTAPPPDDHRDSLEGVLVLQLDAGAISRPQYLRAMERIAARDDERHPLTVPGDEPPS